MSREEIDGLIVLVGVVMLVIVLAARHVTNQRKKHGKYLTRRRLAKWAIHVAMFAVFTTITYFLNAYRFFWLAILFAILYVFSFIVVDDKFNRD